MDGDPTQRRGFYCIDNELLRTYGPQLGPYGIAVLNVIMMHANEDGECWPSHQTIADMAGMSRRQVMREVEKLIELGLVKHEPRAKNGMKQSHIYRICRCDTQSQRCDRESQRCDRESLGCDTQSPHDVTHSPLRCDSQSHKQDPLEQDPIEQNPGEEAATPPTPRTIPARNGASKKKRIESPYIPPDTHFENGFIPPGAGKNAVQVYYERFDITEDAARLKAIQEDDLIHQCQDLERLREVLTAYSRTTYKLGNVQLILDWYHGGVPQRAPSMNGAMNGTHRRNNGFGRDPAPRDPEPEFIPDEKFLAEMERFNAIRNGRAPVPGS